MSNDLAAAEWLPPLKDLLSSADYAAFDARFLDSELRPDDATEHYEAHFAWIEEFLSRRMGLERYLVIDVESDRPQRVQIQLREALIFCERWQFVGWGFKKNGQIAKRLNGLYAVRARILRRRLDATWAPLVVGEPVPDRLLETMAAPLRMEAAKRLQECLAARPEGVGVLDVRIAFAATSAEAAALLEEMSRAGYLKPATATNKYVPTSAFGGLGNG
jgi:hypothetical protein